MPFLLSLAAALPLHAQDAGHRQFDFMIGEWDIRFEQLNPDTGEVVLELRAVQKAHYAGEGHLIVDEWTGYDVDTGEELSHGVTLRTYSEETGRWQHTFLRSGQGEAASRFEGEWRDGEMVAEGSAPMADGRTLRFRLRFYDIEADGFRWMEEWSNDGGASWHLAKTQVATRR